MLEKHIHFVTTASCHSAQQCLRMGQSSVPGSVKRNPHYLRSAISSFGSLNLFQFGVVIYNTHSCTHHSHPKSQQPH